MNRLASMALSDGNTVQYTYDAAGNRLSMMDWHGTTSYVSDLLNRIASITTPDGKTISYTYDAAGNRESVTTPDGKTVQYSYDALNRLSKVTASLGTTAYSYDAAGNLTGFMHPNGAASQYQYDAANRLLDIVNLSGTRLLSSFAYVLDKVGNRVEMISNGRSVNRYGYDNLYRVTSWIAPSGQTTQWNYDGVGNRASMTSSAGTTNYTYDVAEELLTAGATSFTYDGNGNQLTKTTGSTTLTYAWDALNRLLSVVGGSTNTHYEYDGDGNRIAQQVPAGTYTYVNDVASALPTVLDEAGPDGDVDYVYGLSLISASSPRFEYFYQSDGLGSTINITTQTGAERANYSYDPWGKMTLPLDPLRTTEKYKFTGEASDPNDGLVYLRARYYDPAVGRFLSRDPFPGDLLRPELDNSYSYVINEPLGLTDRTGKCPTCLIGADIGFWTGSLEYASNHTFSTFNWKGWAEASLSGAAQGAVAGGEPTTLGAKIAVNVAVSDGATIATNALNGQPWNTGIVSSTITGAAGPLFPEPLGAAKGGNFTKIAGNDFLDTETDTIIESGLSQIGNQLTGPPDLRSNTPISFTTPASTLVISGPTKLK